MSLSWKVVLIGNLLYSMKPGIRIRGSEIPAILHLFFLHLSHPQSPCVTPRIYIYHTSQIYQCPQVFFILVVFVLFSLISLKNVYWLSTGKWFHSTEQLKTIINSSISFTFEFSKKLSTLSECGINKKIYTTVIQLSGLGRTGTLGENSGALVWSYSQQF